MAQQLLQERTPAAYAGVTSYAQRHAKEDAGALAWLAIGYAHVLDHDYAKAIDPLNRARPRAGDLGDYIAYYLGSSSLQTGRTAEAVATLADFSQKYPDSLLTKDAHVVYAGALLADNRAAEAAALLEKDRVPARPDVELGLGRAYAALGQSAKAVAAEQRYYRMPTAGRLHGRRGVKTRRLDPRWAGRPSHARRSCLPGQALLATPRLNIATCSTRWSTGSGRSLRGVNPQKAAAAETRSAGRRFGCHICHARSHRWADFGDQRG
jgi:hypothetical protein